MKIWILPMAGKGTRTQALGKCKPAIVVAGRPILAWCLSGLADRIQANDKIITITTREFEKEFKISMLVKTWTKILGLSVTYCPVVVDDVLPGPAASIFSAAQYFDHPSNVIIVNTDQFIQFSTPETLSNVDAFMPLYINNTGKSSYVEIKNDLIRQVVEKKVISYYASAGVYGFGSGQMLYSILAETLRGDPHYKDEYFVGPSINIFIKRGGHVYPSSVIAKYDLGNVENINKFKKMLSILTVC